MGNHPQPDSNPFYGFGYKLPEYFQKYIVLPAEDNSSLDDILRPLTNLQSKSFQQVIKIYQVKLNKQSDHLCTEIIKICIHLEIVLFSLAQEINIRKSNNQTLPEQNIIQLCYCLLIAIQQLDQNQIYLQGLDVHMIGKTYDSYKIAIPRFIVKQHIGPLYKSPQMNNQIEIDYTKSIIYCVGMVVLQYSLLERICPDQVYKKLEQLQQLRAGQKIVKGLKKMLKVIPQQRPQLQQLITFFLNKQQNKQGSIQKSKEQIQTQRQLKNKELLQQWSQYKLKQSKIQIKEESISPKKWFQQQIYRPVDVSQFITKKVKFNIPHIQDIPDMCKGNKKEVVKKKKKKGKVWNRFW